MLFWRTRVAILITLYWRILEPPNNGIRVVLIYAADVRVQSLPRP